MQCTAKKVSLWKNVSSVNQMLEMTGAMQLSEMWLDSASTLYQSACWSNPVHQTAFSFCLEIGRYSSPPEGILGTTVYRNNL